MARRSRFTTPDAAEAWAVSKGAPRRGSMTIITSKERGLIRFWLTASGVPSETAVTLTLSEMWDVWHDTSGAALAQLITARDATPLDQITTTEPTEPTTPTENPTMATQEPFILTPPRPVTPRPAVDQDARLRALAELLNPQQTMDEGAVVEIMQRHMGAAIAAATSTSAEQAREQLADLLEEARRIVGGAPRTLRIEIAGRVKDLPAAVRHPLFDTLLTLVVVSKRPRAKHPMMVGPAGGGKTTAAEQIAEALGLPFFTNGALSGAHELTGFKDAKGDYNTTPFRTAFEHGGLYLADELDRSDPSAVLALNSALANGFMGFPDQPEPIRAHEKFHVIAACNTYGRGADRLYIGANQLDASTLDRFGTLNWDYDETLERALAGDDAWVSYVQAARSAASDFKIRHVISPRASYYGAELRATGMAFDMVADVAMWNGLDAEQRQRIVAAIPERIARRAQAPVIHAVAAE